MYIPAHFAAGDAAVQELLARHGAADLITLTGDGLVATMLPFAGPGNDPRTPGAELRARAIAFRCPSTTVRSGDIRDWIRRG